MHHEQEDSMTIRKLSNGSSLIEESYNYPDPEIIIRSVFRIEDIQHLKARNPSDLASVVYFYGDRDYNNNLTNYTGETQNSPYSRYKQTHSKKEWCQNLIYPFIGMAENKKDPWDMETRKTIESLVAYKMQQIGFNIVNHNNMNWSFGVTIPRSVNGVYVETVANLIVSYQLALLGLTGVNVKEIGVKLGHISEEIIPDYTEEPDKLITLNDFNNPRNIRAEEKLFALIKTGKIHLQEPFYTTHRIINKAVIFISPTEVDYKGNIYTPRDAIKIMAHEAYTDSLTQTQTEGWSSYDPILGFAVERENERVKLNDLWNSIKPTELQNTNKNQETVDDVWYDFVDQNGLYNCEIKCQNTTGIIHEDATIQSQHLKYYSLIAFGEAANGIKDNGQSVYTVIKNGEQFTINSD